MNRREHAQRARSNWTLAKRLSVGESLIAALAEEAGNTQWSIASMAMKLPRFHGAAMIRNIEGWQFGRYGCDAAMFAASVSLFVWPVVPQRWSCQAVKQPGKSRSLDLMYCTLVPEAAGSGLRSSKGMPLLPGQLTAANSSRKFRISRTAGCRWVCVFYEIFLVVPPALARPGAAAVPFGPPTSGSYPGLVDGEHVAVAAQRAASTSAHEQASRQGQGAKIEAIEAAIAVQSLGPGVGGVAAAREHRATTVADPGRGIRGKYAHHSSEIGMPAHVPHGPVNGWLLDDHAKAVCDPAPLVQLCSGLELLIRALLPSSRSAESRPPPPPTTSLSTLRSPRHLCSPRRRDRLCCSSRLGLRVQLCAQVSNASPRRRHRAGRSWGSRACTKARARARAKARAKARAAQAPTHVGKLCAG
ncbi:hypothetical protein P154DRAFT_594387 [Amniculicola lignicola CBS 123094]|uniref:Uncharacterized protein n=1 Tax=Amniculicola lignicola CBS 123094 TaxID=1392246 RepID=A0A6A5WLY9_9PLEO|nr:hypothetical protein P154DRAFT_594387 [Amniculicola lignicola CBS 123094]